ARTASSGSPPRRRPSDWPGPGSRSHSTAPTPDNCRRWRRAPTRPPGPPGPLLLLRRVAGSSAGSFCTMWNMYHMVHFGMRTSQARERLLAAAVRHALDAGIADLSLRQLAAAIGTSHRMLLYHFGSREGLLVAVTQAVEQQQRAALLESGTSPQDARHFWARLSDPSLWPQERLFFELYAYALRGRPGTEGFLDGIVESWIAPIA